MRFLVYRHDNFFYGDNLVCNVIVNAYEHDAHTHYHYDFDDDD
jgi:hypothetical protein